MKIELSKIQAAICDVPFQIQNQGIMALTIICATIVTLAVIFRLTARYMLKQTYGMDDWFLLAAVVSSLSSIDKSQAKLT